jgi:hypothetical protein
MVSKALSLYNSNIEKTQQYTRDLARDPQSINNIPSKWIRDNTPQYKEFLRNAAKTDPSVLVGKELTILSAEDYLQVVKETSAKNPMALQYLPDVEKEKDGGKEYRALMIEGAKINGSVLRIAGGREYDKYWSGAEKQYKELCVNAVNQNPQLFFFCYDYLQPRSTETFRSIVAKLTPETKLSYRIWTMFHDSAFSMVVISAL